MTPMLLFTKSHNFKHTLGFTLCRSLITSILKELSAKLVCLIFQSSRFSSIYSRFCSLYKSGKRKHGKKNATLTPTTVSDRHQMMSESIAISNPHMGNHEIGTKNRNPKIEKSITDKLINH